MDTAEYARHSQRISQYSSLARQLEKFQVAVEDLKYPEGTLRLALGGGRSTFQNFESDELAEFRNALLEMFRAKVGRLKDELARI